MPPTLNRKYCIPAKFIQKFQNNLTIKWQGDGFLGSVFPAKTLGRVVILYFPSLFPLPYTSLSLMSLPILTVSLLHTNGYAVCLSQLKRQTKKTQLLTTYQSVLPNLIEFGEQLLNKLIKRYKKTYSDFRFKFDLLGEDLVNACGALVVPGAVVGNPYSNLLKPVFWNGSHAITHQNYHSIQ